MTTTDPGDHDADLVVEAPGTDETKRLGAVAALLRHRVQGRIEGHDRGPWIVLAHGPVRPAVGQQHHHHPRVSIPTIADDLGASRPPHLADHRPGAAFAVPGPSVGKLGDLWATGGSSCWAPGGSRRCFAALTAVSWDVGRSSPSPGSSPPVIGAATGPAPDGDDQPLVPARRGAGPALVPGDGRRSGAGRRHRHFVEAFSWRMIFVLQVPLMLVAGRRGSGAPLTIQRGDERHGFDLAGWCCTPASRRCCSPSTGDRCPADQHPGARGFVVAGDPRLVRACERRHTR